MNTTQDISNLFHNANTAWNAYISACLNDAPEPNQLKLILIWQKAYQHCRTQYDPTVNVQA